MKFASCERMGWATRRRASAARWSASARSRSSDPTTEMRAGDDVAVEALALVVGQRPGDDQLEPGRRRRGVSAARLRNGLQQRARVAPGRAEAPGVDERDPLGVEEIGDRRGVGGLEKLGVGTVADQDRIGDAALAQVLRRRARTTQTTTSAAPSVRRSSRSSRRLCAAVGNGGRSGSKVQRVADVGDPGGAPALKRSAHRVRRLGRRGRDDAVEGLGAVKGAGAVPRERRPGEGERLGDDHLAERVRLARVRVGVVERADVVAAAQLRSPELRVGGADDALLGVVRESSP